MMENDLKSDFPTPDDLEAKTRAQHAVIVKHLAELRYQRKTLDKKVRYLVVQERTQARLVAVYDRAAAKAAKREEAVAQVSS